MTEPQPSGTEPHFTFWLWQVIGVHTHNSGGDQHGSWLASVTVPLGTDGGSSILPSQSSSTPLHVSFGGMHADHFELTQLRTEPGQNFPAGKSSGPQIALTEPTSTEPVALSTMPSRLSSH
jgi:hypothetical protein